MTLFYSSLQSIAIGYKRAHPQSVAVVQAFDAKPSIQIKASDQPSVPFRKYGFVDAVEELDPISSLGLLDPDFKVIDLFVHFPLCFEFVFFALALSVFFSGGSWRLHLFLVSLSA